MHSADTPDVAHPRSVTGIDTVIDTARLVLRALRPDDLDDLTDYHSLPEVFRHQDHEPWDREQLSRMLAFEVRQARLPYAVTGRILLGAALKETGRIVGEVMIADVGGVHEVGCTFHPDHQGRGLATEAVGALLTHAFGRLGVERVQACSRPDNARAIRTLEGLGMHRTGSTDGFSVYELEAPRHR
ncbi:GNAT family N-acetyltransferase [Streptomyces sp. NPDC059564]|uniref:GNAT family N-acetyltransferase n=1 Tax=Streptomyces sp. NPDC059564 TaxID=3346865 RepID=UPI003698C4F9